MNDIPTLEEELKLGIDSITPTILIEPMAREYKEFLSHCNNVDLNTTARVCYDLIKNIEPTNVLLIGRGNVGKELSGLILTKTNHTLTVANSHTEPFHLQKVISDSSIILNTSTSLITVCRDIVMNNKTVIDINNNLELDNKEKLKEYYNMRDIGSFTVKEIVRMANL